MNHFGIVLLLGSVAAALPPCHADDSMPPARPNILWLVTEDNSVDYLRLYSEGGAPMPNVERLAQQGIIFNNAFSNAPVCSTARSAIISGCYGPGTFTQFHRAAVKVPLPEGLHMLPWYLRQAGYYTTNNAKEDYNFTKEDGVWDASSGKATYRDRAPGQPFFHVQNFGTTHEGQLHDSRDGTDAGETQTDMGSVAVYPMHPDTPAFRHANAQYRDLHMRVDGEIGDFLAQLEEDGLIEDTIIFFYGDNGGVLPGSKGFVCERGVHVPMVVHVPQKWRRLSPADGGTRIEGFVQFIDLAPTVLNLAGLPVPQQMDGKPFLGNGVCLDELNSRDTAFSYADRFDEKIDFVRALRKGKYKYVRSYLPFNVDALQNNYRYKMEAYREWRELYQSGKLMPEQSRFFEPRPAEALYDLGTDPFEMHNLTSDPTCAELLASMRAALREQILSLPDLSFIPEPVLVREATPNPLAFGKSQRKRITQLAAVADLQLLSFGEARPAIDLALGSTDALQRYWAWIVCSRFGSEASCMAEAARAAAAADPDNLVRMRAAEFLGLAGLEDPRPALVECLKQAESLSEATLILNTITLLHDTVEDCRFALDRSWLPADYFTNAQSNVLRRYQYIENE
jgi:arylsulfatase A-like enzyme